MWFSIFARNPNAITIELAMQRGPILQEFVTALGQCAETKQNTLKRSGKAHVAEKMRLLVLP